MTTSPVSQRLIHLSLSAEDSQATGTLQDHLEGYTDFHGKMPLTRSLFLVKCGDPILNVFPGNRLSSTDEVEGEAFNLGTVLDTDIKENQNTLLSLHELLYPLIMQRCKLHKVLLIIYTTTLAFLLVEKT